MAEVYGYIYLITNIQNNKKYSGKTTTENVIKYIEDHFRNAYKNYDGGTKHFYNAIRKYGRKNFKYIILGECYSEEELNESEKTVIYHYRLFSTYQNGKKHDGIYGYNLTEGGEGASGYTWDDERKRQFGLKQIGEKNHMHHTNITDEIMMKLVIAGKAGKGRKKTEEHIQKIRLSNIGKLRSEETRKRISESKIGKVPWNKGKSWPNHVRQKISKSLQISNSSNEKKHWSEERRNKHPKKYNVNSEINIEIQALDN